MYSSTQIIYGLDFINRFSKFLCFVLILQVIILQKVLEHMLAQFSFFNFAYQVLKQAAFSILQFSLMMRPRGHIKVKEMNENGHSISFVCSLNRHCRAEF